MCLWRLVGLCRVGGGSARLCGFRPSFPYKQGVLYSLCCFGSILLINWVISSIYSDGGYDHFKLIFFIVCE